MKTLFTEPEIEILSFLCNNGVNDSYDLGGNGTEDIFPE